MNKNKSLTIVVIFSIMFSILLYFSYKAMPIAYIIIISILSIYGFLRGIIDFDTWLRIDKTKNNSYTGTIVHSVEKEKTEKNIYEVSDIIEEFK